MATIEASLDAQNEVSDHILGSTLLGGYQGTAQSSAVGLQVIYGAGVTTGDFTVEFQGGFHRSSGTTFGTVATITQAEVNEPITLTVVPGMTYRFRYTSTGTIAVVAMAG